MNRCGTHAVVLGASMAGLVHAVPLAERFDRVTIVDRDSLPTAAEQRRGISQGHHVHLLLPGGVARLEQLFPGLVADLTARGAHVIPAGEWRFCLGGGHLDVSGSGARIVGATRPLIESAVRDRVRALDGVVVLDGRSARELLTTSDGSRVTGVRLRSDADGQHHDIDADLVLDATGRGSPTPRWLAALGHQVPEQTLKVDVHYASRLFRCDPGALDGCRHVLVDVPPDGRRGGVAVAVEGGRWLVTLAGVAGERPPTDPAGFTAYAASLWSEDLGLLLRGATPVGPAHRHAFPAMSRRRYDRIRDLPGGFAVSGDAVCSLDPRFGQGMTVALAEAVELGRVLDRHGLDRVGHRLLAASRATVQDAWDLTSGSHLARPDIDAPRPVSWRLTNSYLSRLVPTAHHDPTVAAALIRVFGMLDRPSTLMHPQTLHRVLSRARPRSQTARWERGVWGSGPRKIMRAKVKIPEGEQTRGPAPWS